MEVSDLSFDEEEMTELINHVFLPRKVPGTEAEPLIKIKGEENILTLLTNVLNYSEYGNIVPSATKELFASWSVNQFEQNPANLSKTLRNIKKGYFGYYIRAQNAGILVRVDSSKNEAILSTFPASLKSTFVMSNHDGEIITTYPEQSIKIPNSDLLSSQALSRQLIALTNEVILDTLSTALKGGSEVPEVREVCDTTFVSEWLVWLLSNDTSKEATEAEFPTICKKVRDQVSWNSSYTSWRRSGLWMVAKVILQLSLKDSKPEGTIIYKIVLAEFMRRLCERANLLETDPDVGMHMIKKLMRRMKKIQVLEGGDSTTKLYINQLFLQTTATCKKFKLAMIQRQANSEIAVNLPQLKINQGDTIFPKLPFIPKLRGSQSGRTSDSSQPPTPCPRNRIVPNQIPNIDSAWKEIDPESPEVMERRANLLYEVESWIFDHLVNYVAQNPHRITLVIREFASDYISRAPEHYKGNPVRGSRMVLAFLQVVHVLDIIAVAAVPLLKQHRSGINPVIIQQLLLPTKSDMEWAHFLELYFLQRNNSAKFPALTEESCISENSFSYRYGKDNAEIVKLRYQILADAEIDILGKLGELKHARKVCKELRSKMNSLTCQCRHQTILQNCGYHALQDSVNSQRVEVYERPLRTEDENQIAVVFELLIPPEIACLRDVVILLVSNVCKSKEMSYKIHGIWTEYSKLSKYSRRMETQTIFKLGSTNQLFVDTHYKEAHPDGGDASFIVNNGYNCTFAGNFVKSWNVKKFCTLSVTPNSLYSGLQWTLNSTNHTQNEVLASQANCPGQLRLVEYKDFGSLRAGHRLQLRNILRSMVENSLSFKEESVFTLLAQTIFETGVPGQQWYRESHEDLASKEFSEELLQELKTQLTSYQENWDEPYSLLFIIILAARLVEFGHCEAVELLLACRKTAYDWTNRIEKVILTSRDTPGDYIQQLKLKLVDACVCICWTFFPIEEKSIFSSDVDLFQWTHAMARIYNNITSSTTTTLSSTRIMLIDITRSNIAINIEPKFAKFSDGLSLFVKQNWNEGHHGEFGNWESFPSGSASHVFHTTFLRQGNLDKVNLQVDLLRGLFLVNGLPVGWLPIEITKHPTFTRVFNDVVFEVYPAVEEKTMITTHRYNNADYRFTLLDDETLIVRERNDTEEFQLIPQHHFENLIPHLLLNGYSHWLNLKTQEIDFRPVHFVQFEKMTTPKFRLLLKSRQLVETSSGNVLFCIGSGSQSSFINYLKRLENSKYIHSFLDTTTGHVRVELPRMQLSFQLNEETGHLINLEYGMEVCTKQKFGTLISLENGLLMENEYNEKKLLVPHGLADAVSVTEKQLVRINRKNLRSPTVFVFDLDLRLQTLRAGRSTCSWLYLAYLHALTSSPLADPFTGLTGTESALSILQSGHCWSCKPYEDQESLDLLDEIKKLSPFRQYYPEHQQRMEMTTWPTGIPSCAASDGFRFIAKKLLADSKRLEVLFPKDTITDAEDDKKKKKDKNVLDLSKRAYRRYEPLFSDEGKISKQFLQLLDTQSYSEVTEISWSPSKSDKNTRTRAISELGHSFTFRMPTSVTSSLTNFLFTDEALQGPTDPQLLTEMSIVELLSLDFDFRNNWLNLYELARIVKKNNFKSEWIIILSILAYREIELNSLLLLQGVAVHRVFFQTQDPPSTAKYICPNSTFTESKVQQIFATHVPGQAQICTTLVSVLWPAESFSLINFENLAGDYCNQSNLNTAISFLNNELKAWNENSALQSFLTKVEKTIAVIPPSLCTGAKSLPTFSSRLGSSFAKPVIAGFKNKPEFKLVFGTPIKALGISRSHIAIFQKGVLKFPSTLGESDLQDEKLLDHFQKKQQFYKKELNSCMKLIQESLIHSETEGLFHTDLFRITPATLLTSLLFSGEKFSPDITALIGAYGVILTLEQRASRCIRYFHMEKTGLVPLTREIENPGHSNWSPATRPEWLLFEIESNLMIRPVQIDVAEQMMNPPEGKHSVMQLNMGEGKTAVIVPLLALSLANGNQVFRVTVLKSLFKTNMASLKFALGGLLNKRIYTIPCQRDLDIGTGACRIMHTVYKECQSNHGVIITLPEHRLSFPLKGYEKCRSGQIDAAKSLMDLQKWLAENVRDVLDESDEILHAKYQLIYTLGSQLPVDGGALRWNIAQNLLKLLPARMIDLQKEFGDSNVDTGPLNGKRPEIFHNTRILKKECYQKLIEWLADDILDRKSPGIKIPEMTTSNQREILRDLLTSTKISKERHEEGLRLLTPTQEMIILILMGFLKYEILHLVLSKRWRVNYGVDPEGDRKMAVPFRAKDVPAKRTEFGHPDVAILLTQLSYYYSGLSDDELEDCFDTLNNESNKEQEYAEWIQQIPEEFVHPSVKKFSSVNLADFKQKYDHLFPILRKNMFVIDFYLGKIVFPKESRTFEKKLVCTPWDLCSEDFVHPTSGFSGTNDCSNLLPGPISQQDLPQLQTTNDEMRETILSEENNNLDLLPRGTSAVDILQKLIQNDIPVLLDSGALLLELDNESVARKWLELLAETSKPVKAAVYYDNDNNQRVKVATHLDDSAPLHSSPYMDKLDQCVIYLDDVHTRGTDLKIPPPSTACVTLCADITRDKMVQACMRMRLLGKGHKIHFFANHESYGGILAMGSSPPGVEQVMEWVCQNSTQFERNGLVYWAAGGINYYHKRLAEVGFNETEKTAENYIQFAEIVCDQEFQSLKDMFGHHREALNYNVILENQINVKKNDILSQITSKLDVTLLQDEPSVANFGTEILPRCQRLLADKIVVSHLLDEEQEKEHEEEPEEEREIIRPPPREPATHKLSPHVVHFIKSGDTSPGKTAGDILPLHKAFEQTTIILACLENWCLQDIFVTRDFVSVIISGSRDDKLDEFLRSPNWLVTNQNDPNRITVLLLSPYEANGLIPTIKDPSNKTILRMFAPRLIPKRDTLISSLKLMLPSVWSAAIPIHLLPPLYMFSGTLYFMNEEEQRNYCYFTGILPQNWRTEVDRDAIASGKVDRGFLLEPWRKEVSPSISVSCGFTTHPEDFARRIIEVRHGYFPLMSHVSKLIVDCRAVTTFDN